MDDYDLIVKRYEQNVYIIKHLIDQRFNSSNVNHIPNVTPNEIFIYKYNIGKKKMYSLINLLNIETLKVDIFVDTTLTTVKQRVDALVPQQSQSYSGVFGYQFGGLNDDISLYNSMSQEQFVDTERNSKTYGGYHRKKEESESDKYSKSKSSRKKRSKRSSRKSSKRSSKRSSRRGSRKSSKRSSKRSSRRGSRRGSKRSSRRSSKRSSKRSSRRSSRNSRLETRKRRSRKI